MLQLNNDEGGGKSKYKREGLNKNYDLKLITEWTEDLGKLMQLQCQNGADAKIYHLHIYTIITKSCFIIRMVGPPL